MAERTRNPRGQGTRLREDILGVASEMLEETGTQGLSLRAIARRVGVSAPALYAHFDDVDVIVQTVVERTFDKLADDLERAGATLTDPEQRLEARCLAYVDFARRLPGRYGILFGPLVDDADGPQKTVDAMAGARAFGLLQLAVADDLRAASADDPQVMTESISLWCSLHGYVTLSNRSPAFPWPPSDVFVSSTIRRISAAADRR